MVRDVEPKLTDPPKHQQVGGQAAGVEETMSARRRGTAVRKSGPMISPSIAAEVPGLWGLNVA